MRVVRASAPVIPAKAGIQTADAVRHPHGQRVGDGERTAFAHMETDLFETGDKGHGRVERRRCRAASAPSAIGCPPDGGDWANMRSVAMVESERRANGETTVGRRYFISSLPACAETILRSVRERWAEKSLKIGVAARRKKAGWDLEYLRSVLGTQMK